MTLRKAACLANRQAWLWRYRKAFGTAADGERPSLLVDVSTIFHHDAQTGIQRVVRAVWSELSSRKSNDFEIVPVYATNEHGFCYAPLNFLDPAFGSRPSELASVRPGDKFLGLDLSAHLLPKYRRQLRAWRRNGASVHLIVYDLLPLLRPEWFTEAAVSHFGKWLDVLTGLADQAICISDQVAHDLLSTLDSRANHGKLAIARLQMGGDIAASIPSTGMNAATKRLLHQIRFRPAIMMVGTIEPRKGYDAALTAFEHLWSKFPTEAPDLIIVGKAGWKTADLQVRLRSHQERGRRLHWFDEVSDEGLCLLYEACRGVLMASHGEGFGLPLIEAAMHRRHILARDLAVFREQDLPNVLYFEDDAPEALGERLLELARIGQSREAPAADVPRWSECVEGLLSVLGFPAQMLSPTERPLRKAS